GPRTVARPHQAGACACRASLSWALAAEVSGAAGARGETHHEYGRAELPLAAPGAPGGAAGDPRPGLERRRGQPPARVRDAARGGPTMRHRHLIGFRAGLAALVLVGLAGLAGLALVGRHVFRAPPPRAVAATPGR